MYVITGGGSGIGRALAHTLADRNQSVLITGRCEKKLQETAAYSSFIIYYCLDVANDVERRSFKDYLGGQPIKGLINNAGTIDPIISMKKIQEHGWQHVLNVNLNAPLFLTQLLLSNLKQGRVLNISSGAAYFPVVGWSAYCVSKAGLSMLTRCWQLEVQDPIFTSVMPGIVDTPMVQTILRSTNIKKDRKAFFSNLQQENRLINSETAASFLAWILLNTTKEQYSNQEWDIYDESHHPAWLKLPHCVPKKE